MLVFISHSFKDRNFVEEKLIPFLKNNGLESWYSTVDIKTSENWLRAILKALQSTEAFVVVLSPDSIISEWVQAETDWALENRKGKVIPVIITLVICIYSFGLFSILI